MSKEQRQEEAARTLVLRRARRQARNIRALDMAQGEGAGGRVSFAPGQVALLQPGELRPGYFAFASAPDDAELEFLVMRTSDPASQALYELRPGERVRLAGVVGRGFPLDAHAGRDLVFVAMGTGVAPLRSALRHVTGRRADFGQIVVLYGARTPEDF